MKDDILKHESLFGRDPTPGLLAVEPASAGRMELFFRSRGESDLRRETAEARPFILLAHQDLLSGWKGEAELESLTGDADLTAIALFPDWNALRGAVRHLQKKTGHTPSAPEAPYLFLSDPVQQYLLLSGRTHFLGLNPDEVRLLAVDIEVYCQEGFEFPKASRPEDRVIAISLADAGGWEQVLSGKDMEEKELLLALAEVIRSRDPDCLVGHNIFRFDLEYLEERAKLCDVELTWGRDGSVLKGRPSRLTIAERSITYRKYEAYGRNVVDTWILAQHYDVATRALPGLGLKEVARHLGVSPADRVYVEGHEISRIYDDDPDRLLAYALDDARETIGVARVLMPAFFVQAQVFPFSFQNVMLRGNATKIDSLFLREYIHQRHSVPLPGEAEVVAGGYTEIRFQGVAHNVLHCDVTSLYPSLMLTEKIFPARDGLGVFGELLGHLTELRLQGKRAAREAARAEEKRYWEAFQGAMKILINSFFGYLAFPLGHFNDFARANRLTARGRELIQEAVNWLEREECLVIEIDTDGIYFCPPPHIDSFEREEGLMDRLAATLPPGLKMELDGRYRAMFSYKMKNYALLDHEGRLTMKGSGLRSRGIEGFQRDFMAEMFRLALAGQAQELPRLRARYRDMISTHRMPLNRLAKTETLQETLDSYRDKVRRKKRAASAVYELALSAKRSYQPGDQLSYYVAGTGKRVKVHEQARLAKDWDPENPDENVEYYLRKLDELYRKFEELLLGGGEGASGEKERGRGRPAAEQGDLVNDL